MTDPRSRLFEMLFGFTVTQALGAAVRLGIPDLVTERPRTPHELARAVGADPDALDSFETFRTGASAFPRVFGQPMFDWLAEHPEESAIFDAAMAGGSVRRSAKLVSRDWASVTSVVDVGGGTAGTLVRILHAHPHLHGTVVDLPHARLVLAESVVRPGNEPDEAKVLDLHMLVGLGGRERSEEQWRALLGRTGFTPALVEPGLVEADPA